MDPITLAERRASADPEFAELLAELIASLEHRGGFELARLYEVSYDDFEILLGVLYHWRLQRFRRDTFAGVRRDARALP